MPRDEPRDMPLDAPDFVLEREIAAAPARVHAVLCDLEALAPLHPLIESIEELDPDPARPSARRHRVVDRIPVGPFRLRSVYVASLESISAEEVHGHAWQSPGIRLLTVYRLDAVSRARGSSRSDARFEPAARATRLTERCHVLAAPRLLRGFVVRQARAAHARTLDDLKTMLEGEAADRRSPA